LTSPFIEQAITPTTVNECNGEGSATIPADPEGMLCTAILPGAHKSSQSLRPYEKLLPAASEAG
jgi:hypothetical protein